MKQTINIPAMLDVNDRARTARKRAKDARPTRWRAGFTLMETLVTVVIITILMAVAFVGLWQWRISLLQLEVDATAQEIYMAAQNHLATAYSQDLVDQRGVEKGLQTPSESSDKIYYFVYSVDADGARPAANDENNPDNKSSALNFMLPFGSIDETVRAGGNYIVRYHPSSGRVLDVFYAKPGQTGLFGFGGLELASGDYDDLVENYRGADHAADRRSFKGGVVGYYGGENAGSDTVAMKAPAVRVVNADVLKVEVTNPLDNKRILDAFNEDRDAADKGELQLRLIVEGEDSGASMWFDLTDESIVEVDGDKYTVYLDDVTTAGGRFFQVVENRPAAQRNDKDFIPGENLVIRAWASSTQLATLAKSTDATTNSLFASGSTTDPKATPAPDGSTPVATDEYFVTVSSFRHLANLSGDVSQFDPAPTYTAVHAEQTTDLSWPDFRSSIAIENSVAESSVSIYYNDSPTAPESSEAGTFLPVTPGYVLDYAGGAHMVSDVVVSLGDDLEGDASAGMFGTLADGSSVSNLELSGFDVNSAAGSAGALAGSVGKGVAITNVLVHDGPSGTSAVSGATAGGLVGTVSAGSGAQGASVTGCAASVLVEASDGAAGGLVGSMSGSVSVLDSYSGGHTTDGAYGDAANVKSSTGAAGGLIGDASGAELTAQYCYSTCSAEGATNAGGLVGAAAAGAIENSYATGKVSGSGNKGAFAGALDGTTLAGNRYFQIINDTLEPVAGVGDGPEGVEALDQDASAYSGFIGALDASNANAAPYDSTLAQYYDVDGQSKFSLRSIAQIHPDAVGQAADDASALTTLSAHLTTHYGDWPAPETLVLNTSGSNSDVSGANFGALGTSTPLVQVAEKATGSLSPVLSSDSEKAGGDEAARADGKGSQSNSGSFEEVVRESPTSELEEAVEEDAPNSSFELVEPSGGSSSFEQVPNEGDEGNRGTLVQSDDGAGTDDVDGADVADDATGANQGAPEVLDAENVEAPELDEQNGGQAEADEQLDTLRATIKTADGSTFTVELAYDERAGIPDGSKLSVVEVNQKPSDMDAPENKDRPFATERFVSAIEMASAKEKLAEGLDLEDADHIFYTEFLDVDVVHGGAELVVQSPVQITITTNDISVGKSQAIEVGSLKLGKYEPLTVENRSTTKEKRTKLTFTTDEVDQIGLAGVARRLISWDAADCDLGILGAHDSTVDVVEQPTGQLANGMEGVYALYAQPDPDPAIGTPLWLDAERLAGSDQSADALVVLRDNGDGTYKKLGVVGKTDGPIAIGALDTIILAKTPVATETSESDAESTPDGQAEPSAADYSGDVLEQTIETADGQRYKITAAFGTDSGIPSTARLSVSEIVEDDNRYDDYIAASAEALGTQPSILASAKAFDIKLVNTLTGALYEPEDNVTVSIELIDMPLDEQTAVDVVHFGEDVEVMDTNLDGKVVEFQTDGFSVYVIVSTTLEKTLTASDGNEYLVSVTYGNASGIPSDAELHVAEIKEGEAGYAEYVQKAAAALGEKAENFALARPFDITLENPETGEEYQPNNDVHVSIQLLNDNLNDYESVNVVHISDDDQARAEVMTSAVNGQAVEFTSDGFSVYVLTGGDGATVTPQCTYTFYVPDTDTSGYKEYAFTDSDGNTVYRQTVTNGNELVVPQPTSTETAVFAGWYENITDGAGGFLLADTPYDFGNITITENSAVDLYAVYTTYATVTFHDQYDSESQSFPVAFTRRVELGTTGGGDGTATVKISDLSATYISSGGVKRTFYGWSETPVETPGVYEDAEHNSYVIVPDENGCISITGDKHLYPIFKEAHRLTYYAAQSGTGADYVPPASYFADEPVPIPLPTTAMEGYTFKGWYTGTLVTDGSVETVDYGSQITEADGTLVESADDAGVYISAGKLFLRSDATLFAMWEANTTADYVIVVKTQSPSDADGIDDSDKAYVYRESEILSGTIGESASVPDDFKTKTYQGYSYSHCDEEATIAADGSTVLNVYYDKVAGYTPDGSYALEFVDSVTEDGKTSADLPREYVEVSYGSSIADRIPADPASGRNGYEFSAWYLDPACTIEAQLDEMTMPDHDLTLYAGWETGWYVVSIDPNYGALYAEEDGSGTGATWFWQSYEGEPIGEYTHMTRDYVESSSGTWYYVNHEGDGVGGSNGWPDRHAYYTQDQGKATEDTTFEYSPGTYTYIGWYEVYMDENGNEIGEASEPYDFSQHVDHNIKLRLHWKKAGTYYLAYAAGDGTLDDGSSKDLQLPDGYADYSEITLTHSAAAPAGYTFIGWQVSGSDDETIYTPGQTITLHGDDAKRVSGKDVIYLDAVYVKVDTASITYNANGGTVASSGVDFGSTYDSFNTETAATGTIDTEAGTATVSGLTNNSKFKLSEGTGFVAPQGSGATFLGWSDKAVCDDSATFYDKDAAATYAVNAEEPTTLYAVWGVQATYSLNSTDADWGGEAWDSSVYTLNTDTNTYTQDVKIGNAISEPTEVPVYTGADGKLFRYWATRTSSGADAVYTEYDFSQPVTGALELHAYWSEPNTIPVHAVDASDDTLADKTEDATWTVTNITVSTAEAELNGTSHVVAPDDTYEFAFAAVASSLDDVSESNAVTAIKYEDKQVKVRYEGESTFSALDSGDEIYFVYYQKKALNIGYKSMDADGVLDDVATTAAPETTGDTLLGEYVMSEQFTDALGLVADDFTDYAFAIGSVDPHDGTQMNASNLSLITDTAASGDPVPNLRIRNTWRGFEYTTETGEDAEWINCGYDPQLYVVYYTQTPTVVMFHEKTVGTSAVMDTSFTYNLSVTQAVTVTTSVQTQVKDGDGNWSDSGDATVTTTTGDPVTVFDTTADGNSPYILANGEANSAVLFYSSTEQVGDPVALDEDTRTVTTTTTVTAQTAVITQTENGAFTTKVAGGGVDEAETLTYTYTANGSGGTQEVIFTNTYSSLPIEVHVALVEDNGASGDIIQRDAGYRSAEEQNYKFDLALDDEEVLLEKLSSAAVFTGDTSIYAFGAVAYGAGSEGSAVTVEGMGVASVSYEQVDDNVYELVLKDGDGNSLGELGSKQIYYLYYPMPKIKYVKEAADGTLADITGCLENSTTGSIEASDSVTYGHNMLTMNGKTVVQNETFEVPLSGFVISQSGNNFRMPAVLDDGLSERYLSYAKIGAGGGNVDNVSALDTSADCTMQLKVQNNALQYSFDGTVWNDISLSGTPTVYAIYTERGYDLQISKTVDTSQSGENAIFSDSSYTVTISSAAITKSSYEATGAEGATVEAVPASGGAPGTITLPVADGTKVRIKGLGRGSYTITESGNENYTLTAKTGPIVGSAASSMMVADNTTVSLSLETETQVNLTNSPKAICRIEENYFYTLQSMIDYVEEHIATKTATAEMLTDYLMPAADTLVVPNGFDITLTTANSMGRVAVITRTDNLADMPLVTNDGTLTLANLTLEGNGIEASAPMIQSAGNLTIGAGATVQNANNANSAESGVQGAAINATAGNVTVSGAISDCTAAAGAAIYHSGNGVITVNGTGEIEGNTATAGDGGAIWLAGGTVKVSGTSRIHNNTAESGNGGAICAGNAVIEVDQGGAITNNTAKEGGAIFVETGTITISKTVDDVAPALTYNTATTGDGGAIHVGAGSVVVSGGNVKNNEAESGNGGAIYANTASVTISGTADVQDNCALVGGAVYAGSGAVAISGGTVSNNQATDDENGGGAIYAGSGSVTVSDGVIQGNEATYGSGGAIYAGSGNVTVTGGNLTQNTAKTDGGAIYAANGAVTLSARDGAAPSVTGNSATDGNGGAICADAGAVSITGITLAGNAAGANGGAVHSETGAVSATNSVFGGSEDGAGNTAGQNGGAIYAGGGNVTVSGSRMVGNAATSGDGGAVYAGSGVVSASAYTASGTTTYTQFSNNAAASGNGGAVYLDSGSATLTSVTGTGNNAQNGAAVYVNTGRATLNAGEYSGNVSSAGGAVGVGDVRARLYFTGNVQVKDNTLGTGADAPKSNVYLDQDDDAVINIDSLGANASIGIHVPDAVVNTRSVPGARFAVYTSNNNVSKITNDRFAVLTVQSDTAAKKLYWGNAVNIEVRYLASYASGLPCGIEGSNGSRVKQIGSYYPLLNDEGYVALSELAADVYSKNADLTTLGLTATAAYGGAFYVDAADYGFDITRLVWNGAQEKWQVVMRNGQLEDLNGRKIYLIYAEPAYVSIENNTEMPLRIGGLTMSVNGATTSVIKKDSDVGYGMVFAKNGSIRSALLPITEDDLELDVGTSINLLIPGGQNMAYTLDGNFDTSAGDSVRLRRGVEGSLVEQTVDVSAAGAFDQLAGTTASASGAYQIIFGDDKNICKVVDASGVEHPYSKISYALADIKNGAITLKTANTATIEMLVDYLLPASDYVLIPRGYDITLTTAAPAGTEGVTYTYNGESEDGRCIISRDSENTESMIDAWNGNAGTDTVNSLDNTVLRISNLVLDGKSVRGSSDGGAVKSKYVNVYVDTVDFKNVYASNGGAMLIMFSAKDKNKKATVPGTVLDVRNSNFVGCTSTTTEVSNRLGGGAIVTNAETMTLDTCLFDTCTAVDQAGAVFHRVDGNYNSWTYVTGCAFTNCQADAAGGLELDSKTITVTDTTFEHCVAKARNGGGFNVFALNTGTPTADCWVTVTGCTFNDCQLTTTNTSNGNGGGFRSNAVYTKVENSTFTNNLAIYGGGFCMSNSNAKKGEVYGCSFERCTATGNGGGVYGKPLEFIVGDCTYTDDEGVEQTRHTEIRNCTSRNHGGGLYHDRNADRTSLKVTNAEITGNRTTANGMNGGGIFTNCRVVEIRGSAITDNVCTSNGGGLYAYSYTSLLVEDSDISRNNANGDGGGVWFDANSDANRANQVLTIKGSRIDGNTSNGKGGGAYTQAKQVVIAASETQTDASGNAVRSSVSNNTAKTNGGGISQSRNADGSKLEISDTDVSGNTVSSGVGGGIYANVRTLTATSSEVSRNSATGNGGGIWFDIENNTARDAMTLTVEGCTLDANTSGSNGGGIYTMAKTVDIKAHRQGTGDAAVTTRTTISNCTASASGGGIYHSRNAGGSRLDIADTTIRGCTSNDSSTAWDHGGGGVFAYVGAVTVSGSEIADNTARGKGGGIVLGLEGNDYMLTIDSTKITGNTSGSQGGGIATRSQLTLRNSTEITGNRLSSNTAADCAGVYLNNNRTLFVGPEDATAETTDTVIVRDNVTANGTLSDLRLWDNGTQNNASSAYVYCNLSEDSEIRVVNAAKVGTQFGSSEYANPDGFSDDFAVFRADSSTLHGIVNRNEESGKQLIWGGPPIAKITDGEGNLLYLKGGERGTSPAIFDRLGTGSNTQSPVAAFNMFLTADTPALYTAAGTLYEGSSYYIKMLDNFETAVHTEVMFVEGRTVTFTTAGTNADDEDGYPYVGSGTRATVTRGAAVDGSKSTLNVYGNLVIENIVLDGGSENGVTAGRSTRCLWVETNTATVYLRENALLQNGSVSNSSRGGGGVYIQSGNVRLEGGVIRNCTANTGGGVFMNGGTMTIVAGSIYQNAASGNGGGICQANGTLTMSGGTISGGSAASGGGVFVANNKVFAMTSGSIVNNTATTAGGGIAIGGSGTRLNFSGRVNVSNNTCNASVAARNSCNVELNQASYSVINTVGGGLYPGSYIGVYVNGTEGTNSNYDKHGVERKPFGTFTAGDNTTTFYSFVNDRNGLKGGIIEETDPNYVAGANCIYWIQIFSLQLDKTVVSGESTTVDQNEEFLFKVNIRGRASVVGQLDAKDIDSRSGDFGEMEFVSNGSDTTTAVFAMKAGVPVTGVNLSEGLTYEIIEYLTLDQSKRYAAMPMNGSSSATETLTVGDRTYTVVRSNTYTGTIGENKSRTDIDPYTSEVEFTNLMPVCKIVDARGGLLYQKYTWNEKTFYAPAVYTELTGDDGAFKALEKMLYTSNSSNPIGYNANNGVQIEMLIADYKLNEAVDADTGKVTLTTASANDELFPKQDAGTTSTIRRMFAENSMFTASGDLTLAGIILDGMKGSYTVEANGGLVNVPNGGKLAIHEGASLQRSRTAEGFSGGAVYVGAGGSVAMTGGVVDGNESVGDGAGIYLAEGSELSLSQTPSFGGAGIDVSGNISTTIGNFKVGTLFAQTNGGKNYVQARQDIFIAETPDDPASVVLSGNLDVDEGSIWVWAQMENHYAMMKPFARIQTGSVNGATYAAFRNAQPDNLTNCLGDKYLSGSSGANSAFIYWSGGFDVSFAKIDGFGNRQPYAAFTLYVDRACTEALKLGDGDQVAVSADGTDTYKSKEGVTLEAGTVLFEQVPAGVYYMMETTVPEGYVNALTEDASGNPVSNVYVVLVGDEALRGAGSGVLADITQEQITAQTGTGDDKKDAAVFLIDPTTDKAVATPNIAKYGIMNISTSERKAILRKVNEAYDPVPGAVFEVLRYDGTKVSSADIDGQTTTSFTSGENGTYFVDMLPYGTYYLHETTIPSGYRQTTPGNDGNWFVLTVNESGVGYRSGNGSAAISNTIGPELEVFAVRAAVLGSGNYIIYRT